MGKLFNLFLSEDVAQLEAFKETLTDEKEIAEVEAKIAELKAKAEKKED